MSEAIIDTPLGALSVTTTPRGIRSLEFVSGITPRRVAMAERRNQRDADLPPDEALARELELQVQEYFEGSRRDFDLPLDLEGSEFQVSCWQGIAAVPYGETMSYGTLAVVAGRPGAARAAGTACGANPVVLLVPCHRIVGSNGSLTGFGAGMDRKVWLLRHEGSLGPDAMRIKAGQPSLVFA